MYFDELFLSERQIAQVLQQDLDAQQDQDDTAQQLRLALVFRAEDAADLHAQGGKQESDHADEADRGQDADL